MDAIIAAGGVPQPGEPLYEYTQGQNKALLDVAGKPMVQWVLDALCQAHGVERIVIIGLPQDSALICSKPIWYIPNQANMLENIRAGVEKVHEVNPQASMVLASSSDIPAITGEMVDWVIQQALQTEVDVYYNIVERSVMDRRYPGSKRSFTKLRDIEVCGGDINVIRTSIVVGHDVLWNKLLAARKNVFKQAALIGYDTALLLILRLISVQQAVNMVSRRLHLRARAVACPYAEVGMDVDKPHQLDMMRADLARRNLARSEPAPQPVS